jgi:hypothetical protein
LLFVKFAKLLHLLLFSTRSVVCAPTAARAAKPINDAAPFRGITKNDFGESDFVGSIVRVNRDWFN